MYTDKEVKEILDRVYAEAYDAGIDDSFDLMQEADKYYRQDRGGKGYLNDPSGKWRYKASDDAMKQQGKFDNFKKRASSGQKVEKIKAKIKAGKNVNTDSFNRKVDKYNSSSNHKYSELNRYED